MSCAQSEEETPPTPPSQGGGVRATPLRKGGSSSPGRSVPLLPPLRRGGSGGVCTRLSRVRNPSGNRSNGGRDRRAGRGRRRSGSRSGGLPPIPWGGIVSRGFATSVFLQAVGIPVGTLGQARVGQPFERTDPFQHRSL